MTVVYKRFETKLIHAGEPSPRLGGASGRVPGGRGLHPRGELSCKAQSFAICPRTAVLFRPTGRTSMKAVLICQPLGARTCLMVAGVPNTARELTATNRRRRIVLII
jgi:hypothetical protein